jgi:hypothetical protein
LVGSGLEVSPVFTLGTGPRRGDSAQPLGGDEEKKGSKATGGDGLSDWDIRDYESSDGPSTDYVPTPELEDAEKEYKNPQLEALKRIRKDLSEPPTDEALLTCPTAKPVRYRFDFHWTDLSTVGTSKSLDAARKLAEGSVKASDAEDVQGALGRSKLNEKALEAIASSTGLKCAPECKMVVDVFTSKFETYVGVQITGSEETGYTVTRKEFHSVVAVVDVSCVA